MADIHQLPTREQAEQEACEWVVRLNADDVSPTDRAQFEQWLAAHPFNRTAYDQLASTWQQYAVTGELARAVSFAQEMQGADAKPARKPWRIALIAASMAAAVIWAFYFYWIPESARFSTPLGEQASISLSDGSIIKLNSNSEVSVNYSPNMRFIHLDRGEAFFTVAHDTGRPFWVVSDRNWIRAVGTEFNVYKKAQGIQVTVNNGSVKVGAAQHALDTVSDKILPTASAMLSEGEQADLMDMVTTKRRLSNDQLANSGAWRTGKLYFESAKLADVVAELNRYTPQPLVLEDESLRSLVVGGTFRADPQGADMLMHMLQENMSVTVRPGQNRFYLQSKLTPRT